MKVSFYRYMLAAFAAAMMTSVLAPEAKAQGKQITTIEGLEKDGRLHPLQEAFIETDAMQCGYCTPGMILASVGLLRKTPDPTEAEIKRGLQGNVCRCGTHQRVVQAVRMAAGKGVAHA